MTEIRMLEFILLGLIVQGLWRFGLVDHLQMTSANSWQYKEKVKLSIWMNRLCCQLVLQKKYI